ncbi:MAG: acetamidase/formamidase family protein [Chloroflexi bacterium]|nr:acetamidase/formamidase family protein [Chloroflexota bacterium]
MKNDDNLLSPGYPLGEPAGDPLVASIPTQSSVPTQPSVPTQSSVLSPQSLETSSVLSSSSVLIARYWYTFGPHQPALRVRSGATVVAQTRDARGWDERGEPIPPELKHTSEVTRLYEGNPVVGPIYVEDAEPGDALAVRIREIRLNRPTAWSSHAPRFGSLTGEYTGHRMLLNDPLPRRQFDWELDLDRMVGRLPLPNSRIGQVEIPLHPFIGSIGVAPSRGRIEMTLSSGDFGGNMDCVDTRAGVTIYFPVWVRGAYLAFGDVHAAQGDGELCGSALETTAEVTLTLELHKNKPLEWPRLEDDTHLMTIANTRGLEDCLRIAQVSLVDWLVGEHGYDKWEAWQVISQVGTTRIGNVVDPNYTVVAKFPKAYLPI